MKMVAVKSSNVEAVGYDADQRVMHVRFKGAATYAHHGVTMADHTALVESPSLGKHYHSKIKDKFGVRKI